MLREYLNRCPATGCNSLLSAEEKHSGRCCECGTEFSPEQRAYAFENPDLYSTLISTPSGSRAVIELADGRIEGRILELYGDWAVTEFGVECLTQTYYIANDQLNDPEWPEHVCEKTWVNADDFMQAFNRARDL